MVHCTITGPCLRMRHRPSARTLQHMTVPIRDIYQGRKHCGKDQNARVITADVALHMDDEDATAVSRLLFSHLLFITKILTPTTVGKLGA